MTYLARWIPACLFAMFLAGCAAEITRHPVTLIPAPQTDRVRIEISEEAELRTSSGYARLLSTGSQWVLQGALPQGNAYKRANGVFTVEGAHVHEAFIVLSGRNLVGFYLPVEQAFSPSGPVTINFK